MFLYYIKLVNSVTIGFGGSLAPLFTASEKEFQETKLPASLLVYSNTEENTGLQRGAEFVTLLDVGSITEKESNGTIAVSWL